MQHTKDIVPYKQIKIISKGFSADRKKREEKLKGLKIYTKEEQKQTCVAMRATVST